MRLVLASASPRRADLLRAAGFVFDVDPVEVDERIVEGETPEAHVLRLARAKAAAVAPRHPDAAVLGSDTVVAVDTEVLGKPAGPDDARRMLERLSGRTHRVFTGVALQHGETVLGTVEISAVRMAALTPAEIAWYVASGEATDKAGAYAIQGRASRFVERIEGSYTAVVGLPVRLVHRLLLQLEGMSEEVFRRGASASR